MRALRDAVPLGAHTHMYIPSTPPSADAKPLCAPIHDFKRFRIPGSSWNPGVSWRSAPANVHCQVKVWIEAEQVRKRIVHLRSGVPCPWPGWMCQLGGLSNVCCSLGTVRRKLRNLYLLPHPSAIIRFDPQHHWVEYSDASSDSKARSSLKQRNNPTRAEMDITHATHPPAPACTFLLAPWHLGPTSSIQRCRPRLLAPDWLALVCAIDQGFTVDDLACH